MQRNIHIENYTILNKSVAAKSECILAGAAVTRAMDSLLALITPQFLIYAVLVGLFAGVIKGMVGFGMPTILISGLSTFLSPELALAGLILPTLVTNGMQALRQGLGEAWASIIRFRVFLIAGGVVLASSAQLVRVLPPEIMFMIIGFAVSGFALMQLAGWQPKLPEKSNVLEAGIGAFAGFIGGLSGVWGPPTIAYLVARNTPKAEQIRVQGVIFGLGAVVLLFAHMQSGVVTWQTLPFSALLVVPAVAGVLIGFQLHDRIDQRQFKHLTLIVLFISGLNLIRRGLMG